MTRTEAKQNPWYEFTINVTLKRNQGSFGGKQYKGIDVHHIAKISQRPDLKFDPDNMICLRREHHDWTDKNHDKAVEMGLLSVESYELAMREERQRVA